MKQFLTSLILALTFGSLTGHAEDCSKTMAPTSRFKLLYYGSGVGSKYLKYAVEVKVSSEGNIEIAFDEENWKVNVLMAQNAFTQSSSTRLIDCKQFPHYCLGGTITKIRTYLARIESRLISPRQVPVLNCVDQKLEAFQRQVVDELFK